VLAAIFRRLKQSLFLPASQLFDGRFTATGRRPVMAGFQIHQLPRFAPPKIPGATGTTTMLLPSPDDIGGNASIQRVITGENDVDQPPVHSLLLSIHIGGIYTTVGRQNRLFATKSLNQ